MSTQFRPLEIPPGVQSKPTKQMRSSAWSEVNLMRWVEGELQPVGGQSQYDYSASNVAFASPIRAIHSWYDLNGVFYIAYLCESNLYIDIAGTLTDITPVGGMTPPPPNVDSNYSDGLYSADDYSTNNPIPPINNLPNVWSLDNFGQILLAMTSSDGRLLQWDPASAVVNVYQDSIYNAAGVGAPSLDMTSAVPSTVVPGLTIFNQSGNVAVGTVASVTTPATIVLTGPSTGACQAGDLLIFNSENAANAQAIPVTSSDTGTGFAPNARMFVVTQERFVMLFATSGDGTQSGGSFRRFCWCDQENFNAWDFTDVVSQAGYLDIEPASPIVSAKATPQGILFWTATRTYMSSFLGLPYIYNYVEIAKACTPWSPMSVASTTVLTLWMSQQGMFSYNGAWVAPIPCLVRNWINDDIDDNIVRQKAFACNVANFNEFWWFFPQEGQSANTRVVIYNYKENWWSMGAMSRSAGVTASYTTQTIMADGTNVYQHELGNVYPNNTPLPWAETFDLNLNSGSRLTTLKQMIPDINGDVNNLRYSVFYRMSRSVMPDPNGFPTLVVEQQTAPRKVNTNNGFVDFRTTGRDMRLRIALAGPQVNFVSVGQHLVDSVARGDR
jgi:hypothetical protein